jgi:hypothetical protein
MNKIEIAARIGDAQFRLASGENQIDVEADLIRLRREIVASVKAGNGDIRDDVLAGYRTDAVAQYARLRELICETDLQTAPDMVLFHLSACAELARTKMEFYFDMRNRAAEGRAQEGISCQG